MINIADKESNGKLMEDPKSMKEVEKNKKKTTKMNSQREQTEQVIKEFK